MPDVENRRLAVLIDADNAQAAIVEGLLAEIAKYGTAHVKRIYGDWTLPNLGSWKPTLLRYSIQPMQQFRYTTGKNATDGAMMIDAMDLLYTGNFDGFCIVSSDSDFTRLASRIRESGLVGLRLRREEDPGALRRCLRQVHLRRAAARGRGRRGANGAQVRQGAQAGHQARPPAAQRRGGRLGRQRLGRAGRGGLDRRQTSPRSSTRAPGATPSSAACVKAIGLFDVEERLVGGGPHKSLYVRDKKGAAQ